MRPPLSQTRRVGHLLVTSGLTARVDGALVSATFDGQVGHILSVLDQILVAEGLRRADVVAINVFLADIQDLERLNIAYRSFFEDAYPVRTTIQCGLGTGVLVELNAQASSG